MSLKKSEIEKFKKTLEEMRLELIGEIAEMNKGVKETEEPQGYSQHAADEGSDDFEKSLLIQVSNKELSTLRQIDRALEKIEEGTYGICDITGEEISRVRLETIPYATMTVKAQEQLEQNNS